MFPENQAYKPCFNTMSLSRAPIRHRHIWGIYEIIMSIPIHTRAPLIHFEITSTKGTFDHIVLNKTIISDKYKDLELCLMCELVTESFSPNEYFFIDDLEDKLCL